MDYSGIIHFLQYLQSLGIHVCIKDYVGFLAMNRAFEETFADYLSHSNPFCMYVKSDKELYSRCISMMQKLQNRFAHDGSYLCGICHAGVEEYVVPLFHNGKLIGSIHAGVFRFRDDVVSRRLRNLCSASKIVNAQTARRLYAANTNDLIIDSDLLRVYLEVVANAISLSINDVTDNFVKSKYGSQTVILQNMIIADALSYMRLHYSEDICMDEIVRFCHCSRSHLSHLFKKRLGVSIPIYVNRLRIERAKELLAESNASMMSIAIQVGFDDPNYFSRVFARLTGLTCSEYRRQVRS